MILKLNSRDLYDVSHSSLSSSGSRISRGGAPTSWGGCQLPRRLRFVKFVCRNERISTLGGRALAAPPGSATAQHGVTVSECSFDCGGCRNRHFLLFPGRSFVYLSRKAINTYMFHFSLFR